MEAGHQEMAQDKGPNQEVGRQAHRDQQQGQLQDQRFGDEQPLRFNIVFPLCGLLRDGDCVLQAFGGNPGGMARKIGQRSDAGVYAHDQALEKRPDGAEKHPE